MALYGVILRHLDDGPDPAGLVLFQEKTPSCAVEQADPFPDILDPYARAGGGRKPLSRIPDLDAHDAAAVRPGDDDFSSFNLGLQAVFDGVLHERLEQKRRKRLGAK